MKRLAQDWLQIRTDYVDLCGLPLWLHALAAGDELVLLDSGVAATPQACVRGELAAAGLRIEDITLVVNSHAHPDHMGGNAALRDICAPRFAGPAAEATWLEDNDLLIRELWEPNPDAYRLTDADRREIRDFLGERVRIDVLLRHGDQLTPGGSRLRIVSTSGHSPGHLAVHDVDRRVLFTFDDVQGGGVPIAGTDTLLAPLYHDVRRYRAGLRGLRDLDFDLLVSSHGDPVDRAGGLSRIDDSLAFVDAAEEFVADYVRSRDVVTLRELAADMGSRWRRFGGVNLQTMSIAKAHLQELVRRGEIVTQWRRQVH